MSLRKSDRLPFSGAPGHRRVRGPCTLTLPPRPPRSLRVHCPHVYSFLSWHIAHHLLISIVLFVVVLLVLRPTSATKEGSSNLDSATSLIPMPSRHPSNPLCNPRLGVLFCPCSTIRLSLCAPRPLMLDHNRRRTPQKTRTPRVRPDGTDDVSDGRHSFSTHPMHLCLCPASFTALLDGQAAVSSAATQAGQQKTLLPASSNANRRSTGTNPTRRGVPDAQTSIHGDAVNSSRLPPCPSVPISD
ncbi:hypothetical protein BKA80DRAFT_265404 [Phyllosticta citrichinensis]